MKFFRKQQQGVLLLWAEKPLNLCLRCFRREEILLYQQTKILKLTVREVCSSIEEAAQLFENDEKVFIIGGGRIYSEFLPFADKLYLTEVDAECDDADTFFPHFDKEEWVREVLAEHNEEGIDYQHILYTKSVDKL